ncbi:unnamed protein product [Rhizophagus irregularis]|nr:unnamed protein product [Rhizophagus irregularis]CAB4439456.1 unnamed protein product [Rhizophagus irregularis]
MNQFKLIKKNYCIDISISDIEEFDKKAVEITNKYKIGEKREKGINSGRSSKAEVSTSSIPKGRSKSRLPISILPADETDEKRKHIIGLVLEQFPYLSLGYSENYGDKFVFNSSVPCPICNKDHEARMVKTVDGAVVSILENELIALSAEGKMVCQ